MQYLIRLYFDIILHRKGPQDVPADGAVLGFTLLAYLFVGAAALWPSSAGAGVVAGQLVVDLTLLLLVVSGLLAATGRRTRLRQTLTALFGTGALLSAIALPFMWIASQVLRDGEPPAGMEASALLSTLALLVLLLVSLLVTGHILRHALDWSYAAGVAVAVAYFALTIMVFQRLFPVG